MSNVDRTTQPPLVEPRIDARITCRRCRRASTFRELPRIVTLRHADLVLFVVKWKPDVVVDVRACVCGESIARLDR